MKEIKIPEDIKKEIEHLKKTGIPRCSVCKKDFINYTDSISGKISKYSWKPDCEHNKDFRIMLG